MIKAIIFDGGGTIWDSMEVLFQSYKWAFEELGLCKTKEFPFSLDDCNKLCGLKDFNTEYGKAKGFIALYLTKTSIKDIIGSEDPNEKLLMLVKVVEKDKENFSQLSISLEKILTKYLYEIFDDGKYPLCEGVKDTLENLKNMGILLGMVSNRRRTSTLNILRSHEIEKLFDPIITWEDQTKPKPSPEGIEKAISKWGLKREDIVFIGDSSVDVLSGKSANLKTIGVLSGMADRKILESSGADIVIENLSQINQPTALNILSTKK